MSSKPKQSHPTPQQKLRERLEKNLGNIEDDDFITEKTNAMVNNEVFCRSSNELNINRIMVKKTAKAAVLEYMQRSDMFPKQDDFQTKKLRISFEDVLHKHLDEENFINNNNEFQRFLHSNVKHWMITCNNIRKKIIWKCKEKYFSKLYKKIIGRCLFLITN